MGRTDNRGFALIGSYLLIALVLVYSNTMTMRTMTERMAEQRLAEQLQALDLARGAMEQLREDVHSFYIEKVYAQAFLNNAVQAYQWLDAFGQALRGEAGNEVPFFSPDGRTPDDPLCVTTLPTANGSDCAIPVQAEHSAPRAWVVNVCVASGDANNNCLPDDGQPQGDLTPRIMTMEAVARVGSSLKRIQADYQINLGMADVFRNAYFINNYGWFEVGANSWVDIYGEARSNGDLHFASHDSIWQLGDVYAASNPDVINPVTNFPSDGTITGDPGEITDGGYPGMPTAEENYLLMNSLGFSRSRPLRQVTAPGQPPIGGTLKTLPYGFGWNNAAPGFPEQMRSEHGPTHPMPYLGDLSLYKELAQNYQRADGGTGSKLTYLAPGPNGIYGDSDDAPTTLYVEHNQDYPLILMGTWNNPIRIDGPVVVKGDVIIKGFVTGRGTIYAGRNVHVIGETQYVQPATWPTIQRDQTTGQLRLWGDPGWGEWPPPQCDSGSTSPACNLGTVDDTGVYTPPPAP